MTVQVIFVIRHGEKPVTIGADTYNGITILGNSNSSCLIPKGWQRAGALATLFDTAVGTMRTDLAVPNQLYAPAYTPASNDHRTYETILPLSLRLNLTIDNTGFPEGQEAALASHILDNDEGVSLVCWEHDHIPAIAAAIPLATDSKVPPTTWPGGKNSKVFDIIWTFTQSSTEAGKYDFTSLNQFLLSGDTAL